MGCKRDWLSPDRRDHFFSISLSHVFLFLFSWILRGLFAEPTCTPPRLTHGIQTDAWIGVWVNYWGLFGGTVRKKHE
ncbi:hypothetical protein B0J18DRAFT_422665 [Chaetomium sp. MPI-SDFR-AT-0129]|nr:hypothetical protein B0J18DRAFT_422665 [Chaetomium sp. MPI-SDFR-AT-0129]